jgi:hypothetical protein
MLILYCVLVVVGADLILQIRDCFKMDDSQAIQNLCDEINFDEGRTK